MNDPQFDAAPALVAAAMLGAVFATIPGLTLPVLLLLCAVILRAKALNSLTLSLIREMSPHFHDGALLDDATRGLSRRKE